MSGATGLGLLDVMILEIVHILKRYIARGVYPLLPNTRAAVQGF